MLGVYEDLDPGADYDIRAATLDADPRFTWGDLALSLTCINEQPVGYLSPYSLMVPVGADTYAAGIWEVVTGEWADRVSSPTALLTDEGSSLIILNRATLLSILTLMNRTASGLPQGQEFSAGIWTSHSDDPGIWGSFDPRGLEDGLEHLGCY